MPAGSWSSHPNFDIRHFSGTALYRKTFLAPAGLGSDDAQWWLDLIDIANLATVTLNGHLLPTLWKPPYRLDVTKFPVPGRNILDIAVTNTWINRLIGDASKPIPERHTTLPPAGVFNTNPKATDPLLPAGLLHEVILRKKVRAPFRRAQI